ncbi:MAG: hypothetical protein ACOC5M_01310 [Chloroflexota bacterium]
MLIPVLALGGALVTVVIGFVMVFVMTAWFGEPLPVFGFGEGPEQPVAFPHTVHAGTDVLRDAQGNVRQDDQGDDMHGLGLDCTFCHRTVTTGASAGVPPVEVCATCHRVIGSSGNDALQNLRDMAGISEGAEGGPIKWRRVHRLPDHVQFVHEPHVRFLTANPGEIANRDEQAIAEDVGDDGMVKPALVCSTCHGDVKSMEKVKQVEPLKMGQCVDCHRQNRAPTTCDTCHF